MRKRPGKPGRFLVSKRSPRADYPLPLWERVVSSVSEKPGEGFFSSTDLPLTRLNLITFDFATLSHKGRGKTVIPDPAPSASAASPESPALALPPLAPERAAARRLASSAWRPIAAPAGTLAQASRRRAAHWRAAMARPSAREQSPASGSRSLAARLPAAAAGPQGGSHQAGSWAPAVLRRRALRMRAWAAALRSSRRRSRHHNRRNARPARSARSGRHAHRSPTGHPRPRGRSPRPSRTVRAAAARPAGKTRYGEELHRSRWAAAADHNPARHKPADRSLVDHSLADRSLADH